MNTVFALILLLGARHAPTHITIHCEQPGIDVSKTLYGVFFEEINHAGDGGLYGELVRNRNFQEGFEGPIGWTLQPQSGDANMTMQKGSNGLKQLRISISNGSATLVNSGYWGIGVKEGERFRLRVKGHAKGLKLSASLGGASQKLPTPDGDFDLTADLRADKSSSNAALAVKFEGSGDAILELVSLFPRDTFKGRANGLRKDLAELVAGIHPSFVRFPGGCYVEGQQLANRFNWKATVTDIANRPGHMGDVWMYRSTDGLGYHEYLQWCEDMGAEPLFVINCGMSHTDHRPLNTMDEYVQSALDAIEYANGDVHTTWGALRAKNGHPKPFNLRMMEIGNENGGTLYQERFALFHDAIKKRYPNMILVANEPIEKGDADMVDEHYYSSEGFFLNQSSRYDAYRRGRTPVYVGEYAVTQGCGQGNLRAALGEAAFMTGMEKNSDIVKMCSYAPLLVNVNDRRWNPDAIVFDSSHSYGTPSYYVQKMFAENRADVIYPVDLPPVEPKIEKGTVGVGSWRTQVQYKDLEVTSNGQNIDIPEGAKWTFPRGDWKTGGGVLAQSSTKVDCRAVLDDQRIRDLSNYTIRVKAKKTGGDEGFLILFRVGGPRDYYWWNVGGWGNSRTALEHAVGGGKIEVGQAVSMHVDNDRWYDIRVEAQDNHIRCFLDDKLVQDVTIRGTPSLTAVAGLSSRTNEIVVKVVNADAETREVDMSLTGTEIRNEGKAITLTSASLDDENSMDNPTRVSPISSTISGLGTTFAYSFPPHSVTILRLKQKQETHR